MTSAAAAFLTSLGTAAVGAYPIYRGLLAIKSRQTVSQHVKEHAHKQGTPTMGGLIVVVGMLPWVVQSLAAGGPWLGVLWLIVGYGLIGFIDDFVVPKLMKGKRGLGWTQKLLMETAFALVALQLGGVKGVGAAVFGTFMILFYANAFNFSDGLDWLSSSILVALALGLGALGFATGAAGVVVIAAILLGAILPFMVLNRPPAKIFMGDVGSMPIGALIGIAIAAMMNPDVMPGLAGQPAGPLGWVALFCLSVMMFAELVPVPIQIASVKLRKGKRVFPATPIHHAFQRAGWKETKVVVLFFAVQVVGSLLAVALVYGAGGKW